MKPVMIEIVNGVPSVTYCPDNVVVRIKEYDMLGLDSSHPCVKVDPDGEHFFLHAEDGPIGEGDLVAKREAKGPLL